MTHKTLIGWGWLLLSIPFASVAVAQDSPQKSSSWTTHFSLQSDLHYSTEQREIKNRLYNGTYITGMIQNQHFQIGARIEELIHPLPGYEEDKGWGLPYLYLRGRYRHLDLTIGDIYEQFGSGLLLRSYEDRSLGIDNSIRGGRLSFTYKDLIATKLIAGQHRNHFDRGWGIWKRDRGFLSGGDVELNLSELIHPLMSKGVLLRIGGSYVLRHEQQDEISQLRDGVWMKLIQPEWVPGWSSRVAFSYKDLSIDFEYAYKGSDPNTQNNYIYKDGMAAVLTASYLIGRNSFYVGVRRSDNFDFRSERSAMNNDMKINFLKPFTRQHTYTLAALYPYATQPRGEWSFQGEWMHRIPKGSWLGGRYGASLNIAASLSTALHKEWEDPSWSDQSTATEMIGSDGYKSSFFGLGEKLFHDIDLTFSQKVSRSYKFTVSYMNQYYHQAIIEGHAERGDIIHSNVFIYDGTHKLSQKVSLRTELQYLTTRQAEGDWAYGLLECSIAPRLILSVSDQWNVGTTKRHYYMGSVAYSTGAHRLQLSYGKTREGINCSGGVCRLMPATEGVYLSYNLNL